ncbi:MAG: dynamin family protein [Arcobacter sp.]|nr:dynamin family protein [Arcobacter sp.]
MPANIHILQDFIREFKEEHSQKVVVYEDSILGKVKEIKDKLLDDKFLPSKELENVLNKQIKRASYPMEVAITGQFSAGKSTFLNALLSKDILPTGITPVTSKVNFISYAEEYKLKITYHSGTNEFTNIENIASFTDQRKDELEDIKYLTLYAPMDILKDISFVDTPGLNSQSQSDTDVTKNILKDVGGIIWLTLIDNAGKQSEAKVLDEYMQNFKEKSLCVLNQKDKFTQEQIQTTQKYIEDKFSKYFAQVTPISAKLAKDSRVAQKSVLINNEIDKIKEKFKEKINANLNAKDLDFFVNDFDTFQKEIKQIQEKDISSNLELLKESNIQEVLSFIENTMRPKAQEAKEYKIKNNLKDICDILINDYHTIIGVYDALYEVVEKLSPKVLKSFDEIQEKYSKELFTVYNSIETIMEKMANEIFNNIKTKKAKRFEKSTGGFLKSEKLEEVEYEALWIDADNVFKNLFYDDQTIDKMLKRSIKMLKNIELLSDEAFRDVYRIIQNEVKKWQEPYELIQKNRAISSHLEYSNTRHFAARVYENILRDYNRAILENISALRKKFAYFNGALSYSYMQITQATISHFEQQILESEKLYKKEPTRFSISHPSEDEILIKLKANFAFEKIEDFLTSKRNYLFKVVRYSKNQYLEITKDRLEFIKEKEKPYHQRIQDLEEIKEDI